MCMSVVVAATVLLAGWLWPCSWLTSDQIEVDHKMVEMRLKNMPVHAHGTQSPKLVSTPSTQNVVVRAHPPPPRRCQAGENKDVIDGIGSAGGSLARGLSDGVSGLIKNPLKGAERGGFAGFAKGVGTGMLGLVVKPVVGVTDAATDLLQGVLCFLLWVLC